MNRHLWTNKDLNSHYPCPQCNQGSLSLDSVEDYQTYQSKKEDEEAREEGWGPYSHTQLYNFRAMLICNRCKENVLCVGEAWSSRYHEEAENYPSYRERLQPKCFLPSLKIIKTPKTTPRRLKEEITNSFELFWMNESACANSIRKVLELLMDEASIPKTGKKGGFLPLQERIKQYSKVDQRLLSAVKEIGNVGSHSEAAVDSVLDGYELLEHVLELLYTDKQSEYIKLAEDVIKKHSRGNK
jgi:hypothetical protein